MRGAMLAGLLAMMAMSSGVRAECACRCVNGSVQALCSSPLDIEPICAPAICPIVPPAVRPVDPPTVPPIGTTGCRSEQVLDPLTQRYEWRQVCR